MIVAGAGPAGLCAAVASARQGARTALLERFGAVGGNLTLGHVTTCMGIVPNGTLKDEIGNLLGTGGECLPHSVEDAKLSLARWLDQAGVVLYLQTQAVDVRMEGNRLSGIVASTPEGLGMLSCRVEVEDVYKRQVYPLASERLDASILKQSVS